MANEQSPPEPSQPNGHHKADNPFKSPQVASAPLPDASLRRRRIALVVIAVILTPIAAGAGGFCCCFAGVMAVNALAPRSGEAVIFLLFGAFGLGAIGAAALVLFGFRRWWKSMDPESEG